MKNNLYSQSTPEVANWRLRLARWLVRFSHNVIPVLPERPFIMEFSSGAKLFCFKQNHDPNIIAKWEFDVVIMNQDGTLDETEVLVGSYTTMRAAAQVAHRIAVLKTKPGQKVLRLTAFMYDRRTHAEPLLPADIVRNYIENEVYPPGRLIVMLAKEHGVEKLQVWAYPKNGNGVLKYYGDATDILGHALTTNLHSVISGRSEPIPSSEGPRFYADLEISERHTTPENEDIMQGSKFVSYGKRKQDSRSAVSSGVSVEGYKDVANDFLKS